MPKTVISITPAHNGKTLMLSGDMAVSFDVKPEDGFKVRLFTTDLNAFTVSAAVGKIVNLAGAEVSSIVIGGAVAVYAELQYLASANKFFIVDNNLEKGLKVTSDEVLGSLGHARTYLTRAMYNQILDRGLMKHNSPVSFGYHDLLKHDSIQNTLTGFANFGTLNIGRPLVKIEGATAAPYWTDPGPLQLKAEDGTLTQAAVAGQIDFLMDGVHRCAQFTSKVNYGDAAQGKRRVQLNSYEIASRQRVAWELSFKVPEDGDDLPYSATGGPGATEYRYPVLFWQLKGGDFPTWGLNINSVGDGESFDITMTFRWSGISDGSVMRRQYYNGTNSGLSGNLSGFSNTTKYIEKRYKKGQWVDMVIEMFLDERDPKIGANGAGYCNVWINGEHVLAYVGPTLMFRDADGLPPPPHHWGIGIYRHESPLDTNDPLSELNLANQTNPAPYQRQIRFRRARLVTFSDPVIVNEPYACTWADRPVTPPLGTIIQLTNYENRLMRWDGSFWSPENSRPWAQSGATITHTNNLSETPLFIVPIPANILGPNGTIKITMIGSFAGGASWKALRLRLGGNTVATSTRMFLSDNGSSAANISFSWNTMIRNKTTNSQVGAFDYGSAQSAVNIGAIDTTLDQFLMVTGQGSALSDVITVHSYTVEILPG